MKKTAKIAQKTAKIAAFSGTLLFIFALFLPFSGAVLNQSTLNRALFYWDFDEPVTGNFSVDAINSFGLAYISTPNDGTYTITELAEGNYSTGLINNAVNYNSTTASISNQSNALWIGTQTHTVTFWLNFKNLTNGNTTIVSYSQGGVSQGQIVEIENNGTAFNIAHSDDDNTISKTTADLDFDTFKGNWFHVGIINIGSQRFFINGVEVTSAGSSGTPFIVDPSNITTNIHEPNVLVNDPTLSYLLEELLIWNITLTASDIADVYLAGISGMPYPYNFVENSQTFNNDTIELSLETFEINASFNTTLFPGNTVTLIYNNTEISSSLSDTSGNERVYETTFQVPSVTIDTNISFVWQFELVNQSGTSFFFNSSVNNQTVNNLGIDDCSTNTVVLLNLTVVDENSQVKIPEGSDDNVTVEIDMTLNNEITFNRTYVEENSVAVCISSALADSQLRLDAQIQYSAFDHVAEFVNLQNFTINSTRIPQNITLFDLDILSSQEFRITYKDENFLPVPGGVIDITRKYIGESVFKSVESPLMDDFGQTIGHFVLTDAIYTIIIKKEGQVLSIFENVQAICADLTIGECEINLNAFLTSRDFTDFTQVAGMSFLIDYDDTTREASTTFTTDDGSVAQVSLNVTEWGANSTVVGLCSNQISSSSGVVTCTVPQSAGNTTIIAQVFKDGQFIAEAFFITTPETPEELFGESIFIILLIMIITLPMMMIVERVAVVIFAAIGFMMAAILGIYSGGSVIGWGSSIMWLVIAALILAWKIGRAK